MGKLAQKIALVTGANSGIGFTTAEEFIKEGATVIITGRRKDAIEEAAKKLGDGAIPFVADSGNLQDLEKLATFIENKFGKLDIVFSNAGIAKFLPVSDVSPEAFEETMNINFRGSFFLAQKVLPLMQAGGAFTFNTSICNVVGMPTSSLYSASKGALAAFARVLATEVAPKGIRVNCVSPGTINTTIQSKLGLTPEMLELFNRSLSGKALLQRQGHAKEIARTVVFLSSDDAGYITGVEIPVDGGYLNNPGDR